MFNAFTSSYNTSVSQTKRGVCTASDKILLCVIVRVDLLIGQFGYSMQFLE